MPDGIHEDSAVSQIGADPGRLEFAIWRRKWAHLAYCSCSAPSPRAGRAGEGCARRLFPHPPPLPAYGEGSFVKRLGTGLRYGHRLAVMRCPAFQAAPAFLIDRPEALSYSSEVDRRAVLVALRQNERNKYERKQKGSRDEGRTS